MHCKRCNNKRLLHDVFHIGPGISLRLPYQGRGLIPGTIWKISCHNLFITYFTLTFSKHWLLYCKKDLWTDKLRKINPLESCFNFVQLTNIFVSSLVSKIYQTMPICTMTLAIVCKIYTKTLIFVWKFLFNTTYTFELIIPFQVI